MLTAIKKLFNKTSTTPKYYPEHPLVNAITGVLPPNCEHIESDDKVIDMTDAFMLARYRVGDQYYLRVCFTGEKPELKTALASEEVIDRDYQKLEKYISLKSSKQYDCK